MTGQIIKSLCLSVFNLEMRIKIEGISELLQPSNYLTPNMKHNSMYIIITQHEIVTY